MDKNIPQHDLNGFEFDTSAYDNRTADGLLPGSRRNMRELAKLINRLFDHHSRILVVRIDLGYRREVSQSVPIELVQSHRDQLLADRHIHPEAFAWLVGHAWCLECGEKDGSYHFHLLALYNGNERRDDIGIGMAIGELWDDITDGCGRYYISNYDKPRLQYEGNLGIGMIHRDDVFLRVNLIEKVAPYITKKCTVFDIQSSRTESGNFRAFGRSWMPAPLDANVPRRGRRPANRPPQGWNQGG